MFKSLLDFIKSRWSQEDFITMKKKDDDYWEDHHKNVLKTLKSYRQIRLLSPDTKQYEFTKISNIILQLFEKSIQLYPESNYFLKEVLYFKWKYLTKSKQFLEIFDAELGNYDLDSKFHNKDQIKSIEKIRSFIYYSRLDPNAGSDCSDDEESIEGLIYRSHLSRL